MQKGVDIFRGLWYNILVNEVRAPTSGETAATLKTAGRDTRGVTERGTGTRGLVHGSLCKVYAKRAIATTRANILRPSSLRQVKRFVVA